jgi:hypothetical protein
VNIHTTSNDLNPLSEKLGINFTTLGSPPVWGPNASVIPAVMPRRIALPPPKDLPTASVSNLENGTPVSITKQIKKKNLD